ncbi:MAG TPA: trehalase family glycosidase [Bryobacteraceae bacterium]|nr:trehalase family glycosidase [Bryobacteraceae bacterium]HTS29715.1 trehalase family glycosidase [Bryobacteraceae bacterium]
MAHTVSPELSAVALEDYIKREWLKLVRSHDGLSSAAADSKTLPLPDGRLPVYLPATEDIHVIESQLRGEMKPADFRRIALLPLPPDPAEIHHHGLLYLPFPYLVPGGRFNEMYAWDSFFIQMGLLRDGEVSLARNLADNALYQVRKYGKVLNANRTYYLTRSHPPILTEMILAIFRQTGDRKYLSNSMDAVENYYRFWTEGPHLIPETGLSRYFDTGSGPAPEAVASEFDRRGRPDYDRIRNYYRRRRTSGYDTRKYYDRSKDQLTLLFYQNDRSMRESGFDPTSRFGLFGAETIDCNPVCLNCLLYLMESQAAEMLDALADGGRASQWREHAAARARRINGLMWDSEDGMYFDYDWVRGSVRRYPFLTTFYPLWVGIASQEQAARVMSRIELFERPGGLQASTHRSGDQWDAPFGWAPLEWIAVQGMRRYGYKTEADRISQRFIGLVQDVFRRRGTIVEKYDVLTRNADVDGELRFGYSTNEAGFGWTNAVYTALLDGLRK